MATASSSGAGGGGEQNAFDVIAASTTDSPLVAAVPNRRIRVLAAVINQGDTTPSPVTFNSKSGGAGTAIGPVLKAAANGVVNLHWSAAGWFDTNVGEGLSVTTGAGSNTGVLVKYKLL